METKKVEVEESILEETVRRAAKWCVLVDRLNMMLENYPEKDISESSTYRNIMVEAGWIVHNVSKYDVNW